MSERTGWAIRLSTQELLASGALRLRGGVEVCLTPNDGVLWLRGRGLPDDLDYELRKIATDGIFTVTADGTFFRRGWRLPTGRLPAMGWQPLDQWLKPVLQPTAAPANLSTRIGLRLKRCSDERPPALLLTDLYSWAAYARTAPAVRLSVLTMAVSADGRVVVRGNPLPSIQGERYTEASGIAVPCGWQIQPVVDPSAVVILLGLGVGDLALFKTDGSYEHVQARCFVRATRAATRETLLERQG